MEDLFWTNFGTIDWVIVGVYCSLSVVVGLIANRYVGNLADFIVAGRGLRTWLGLATMTGTEIGLVTLMYMAEWGYNNGFTAYYTGLVWGVAFLVIGSSGFIIHRLREMRCMTIPEYYARRYGRGTRILGGCLLAFSGILNMGLFLQVGAKFVTVCTGIPEDGGGLKWVMTGMLTLVLVYTILGGMISVVITDLIQFVVLGFGILIATVYAVTHIGWGDMVSTVQTTIGAGGFNPFAGEGGFGPWHVVWQTFVAFAACALWETATLRALASSSPKVAKKMYMGSAITFSARFILPATWGIAALAYIQSNPALVEAFKPDGMAMKAMPLFLAQNIPTVILGILAAGMFAAFMSTHDSYLIAWSAVLTQDVIAPLRKMPESVNRFLRDLFGPVFTVCLGAGVYALWQQAWLSALMCGLALVTYAGAAYVILYHRRDAELTDRDRVWLTRGLLLVIGAFLLVFGLWYETEAALWDYMAVTGSIYFAGAFVAIGMGMYWKPASRAGACAALCCGLFSILGILPWKEWGQPWITPEKVGICTVLLAITSMVVGSLLFPDPEGHVDRLTKEHEAQQEEAS